LPVIELEQFCAGRTPMTEANGPVLRKEQ
jgi:hypothetical protein